MQITSAKSVTVRNNVFLNNFCYPYTYLDQVSRCHKMPGDTRPSKSHAKLSAEPQQCNIALLMLESASAGCCAFRHNSLPDCL